MAGTRGYKALTSAIAEGDLDALRDRIAADPEAVRHWKPIVDAAFGGRAAMLEALIDAGADPNVVSGVSARHTPLTRIAQHHTTIAKHDGHLAAMRTLLERGADPDLSAGPHGFAPMAYSAMAADLAQIALLKDAGATADVYMAAILLDRPELERLLANPAAAETPDARGRTPLQYVAFSGMWKQAGSDAAIDCAALLLEHGADVNTSEDMQEGEEIFRATPLWRAIGWQKNLALAAYLLERGADPNPAVFTATFEGGEACDLLDRYGADWEQPFNGRTPLMDLMHFRRPAGAAWLIRRGVDVNARGVGGRTALHYAALQGVRADYVQALIDAGADRQARDDDGNTPLDHAAAKKRAKLIGLLG